MQKKPRWDYYFKKYDLPDGCPEIPIVASGLRYLVLGDGDHGCFGQPKERLEAKLRAEFQHRGEDDVRFLGKRSLNPRGR